jgi:hypothetical protein
MSDRSDFLTSDLPVALAQRLAPAITIWNRLEARPRADKFERALKAEVRDALWMLTRQWQLGEFRGDDAGSPIEARLRISTTRLRKYQAGEGDPVEPFDDEVVPLETRVERRPVNFTLDLRMLMGRQWQKILPFADLRDGYRDAYPIAAPDPTKKEDFSICAHPEAWSSVAAAAGRRMDGAAFYLHLKGGGDPSANIANVAGREPDIADAAGRFVKWFERMIAQPGDTDAWVPERLEYQFSASAPLKAGEKVLTAEEYYQGHLDWYSVDIDTAEVLGDPAPPDPDYPTSVKKVMIPTPASFDGMPNTRWWAFEEGRTNFGDIKPDTTDLGKLLLIEFGLTYANDWFLVPFAVPAGSIARVEGAAVTNVFGERTWIQAASRGFDDDWRRWAMYLASIKGKGRQWADTSLLLLPIAPKVNDGPALEEVMLVRDEIANMVWAIETTIPLPNGEPKRGVEAARELRAFHVRDLERRLGEPPDPPPLAEGAQVRYDVMSDVPENWLPFIPVHRDGETRSIQLQRAALLRILTGDPDRPEKVRPRTSLLRQGLDAKQPYYLHEEEVPRAGVVVTQRYQRTRWHNGRAWVWLGVRKQTGRGEAHSGLAFDRLVHVRRKKK